MKIQDALFFIVLIVLFYNRNLRLFVIAGLACIALSIPFFYTWTFFTAERLTWYAAAFLLASIVFSLRSLHKVQ